MSTNNLDETIKRVLADGGGDNLSDERNVRAATSPHQQEFPYDRGEEAQVTRREFCNFLALTSTALFVSAAGFAGKSVLDARGRTPQFAPARIEGAENLQPGAALNFRYPREEDTAILVRTPEGNYHAYGQKCTHLACPVYYEAKRGRLECPCHEGGFDVQTGNVLYGPPPRPLDQIALEVRAGGEVWAVGERRAAVSNTQYKSQAVDQHPTFDRQSFGDAQKGASLETRTARQGGRGRAAVTQARLILLVMINIAQLWILSATVEAALAGHFDKLLPLVISSGLCWLGSLSLILWWRPASRRLTSTGYIRERE